MAENTGNFERIHRTSKTFEENVTYEAGTKMETGKEYLCPYEGARLEDVAPRNAYAIMILKADGTYQLAQRTIASNQLSFDFKARNEKGEYTNDLQVNSTDKLYLLGEMELFPELSAARAKYIEQSRSAQAQLMEDVAKNQNANQKGTMFDSMFAAFNQVAGFVGQIVGHFQEIIKKFTASMSNKTYVPPMYVNTHKTNLQDLKKQVLQEKTAVIDYFKSKGIAPNRTTSSTANNETETENTTNTETAAAATGSVTLDTLLNKTETPTYEELKNLEKEGFDKLQMYFEKKVFRDAEGKSRPHKEIEKSLQTDPYHKIWMEYYDQGWNANDGYTLKPKSRYEFKNTTTASTRSALDALPGEEGKAVKLFDVQTYQNGIYREKFNSDRGNNFFAKPMGLVAHYTAGETMDSAINEFTGDGKKVVHYIIDKEGNILQLMPDNKIVRGAYSDDPPQVYNAGMIQVELIGKDQNAVENNPKQKRALELLAAAKAKQHKFPTSNIIGHAEIMFGMKHTSDSQSNTQNGEVQDMHVHGEREKTHHSGDFSNQYAQNLRTKAQELIG